MNNATIPFLAHQGLPLAKLFYTHQRMLFGSIFFPFHNIRSEIYGNVANLGYNLKKSIIFYLVTLQEGLAMISGIKTV